MDKGKQHRLTEAITPYKDVILFVAALLCAHFFWKFTVIADEHGGPVFWFGLDISKPFDLLSAHIASVAYQLIHLSKDTIHYIEPYTLRFDTGYAVIIVWSCTGLKQSFIWFVIMLTARGDRKKKLWFIPLGFVCIYLFNLLRVTAITMIMEHHHELFELFHSYVFKYLFYFMLFMLWVWWTEKIGNPKNTTSETGS